MQNLQGRPVVGLRRGTVHNGADEGRYVELRRRRALRLQDLHGRSIMGLPRGAMLDGAAPRRSVELQR